MTPTPSSVALVAAAAQALKERIDEVNRLNVFPVPDGDTGTNMSLTMDAVVREVSQLPAGATHGDVCHAVTHGSLMGARGNSGVILSQVLRGLCEVIGESESVNTGIVADAFERSVTVAFQAVRKPIEGTILTVLRDSADAARTASDEGADLSAALQRIATASFDSVRRTPELLPVLAENGVVDAGGYGLAILIEGFVAAATGEAPVIADVSSAAAPLLHVEPVDDWDDTEFLYCTEFLLFGDGIDVEALRDYAGQVGGSELVVGDSGSYKVHVHTNDPGAVLEHMTSLGEVAEVHVNNMRRQQHVRDERLVAETAPAPVNQPPKPPKPLGFVAVAAGDGLAEILRSLGVDEIVNGGQTMNPSTADILAAIGRVNAEKVIVLPNNKNIVMAANAAAGVADKPVAVVATRSVPSSFSAMLAWDGQDADLEDVAARMEKAIAGVHSGEVTVAIKDAKAKVGPIREGQVIGILDDEDIVVAGDDVAQVASELADKLLEGDAETLTLLGGEGFDDASLEALSHRICSAHAGVSVETHRGGQPLYPVIMAAE